MAFPADRLPVVVEIAPGADLTDASAGWVWTDITSSVRLRDRIQITQGRPDGAGRVDPSVCRLRLDNRTGDFTPRNPLGAYYGSLGRNTPLRVSIRRADDDFARTASNGWGTEPLWGGTWTVTGGSASDYSVSSGTGRQSLGTVNVLRHSLLDVGVTDARILVDVTNPVVPTGAAISHWVLGRVTDVSNYYVAQVSVAVAGAVTLLLFKRVAGALSLVASGVSVGTHAAGNTWRVLFHYQGSTLRAKAWKTTDSEPAAWQIDTADTSLTAGTQIGLASRSETGNTNGTQVIQWDNLIVDVDRFSGFVSSWPPRWDKSGNDATVPIEANGVLRRLGQGQAPAKSPLHRAAMSAAQTGLLAYWPCEDLEHSTLAASAIPGQPAMSTSGTVDFAGFDRNATITPPTRIGTLPLPDLNGGGSLYGTVPAGTSSPIEWAVQFAACAETIPSSVPIVLAEWATLGGTYVRWEVKQNHTPTRTDVIAYNAVNTPTVVVTTSSWVFATPFMHRVDAIQNGANVDVRLWIAGQLLASGTLAGVTLGRVTSFTANPGLVSSANPISIGHAMVWDDKDAPQLQSATTTTESAWHSYLSETFDARLARLCGEEGVSLSMPDVSADFAVRMGAQQPGAFLDLLYECETADQGVLYESGYGLGYVPREARYNRPVALALDFDAGQIAEPPEPLDDDQQLRNRIKVSRTLGSSAVVEDTDSISTHGLYDDEVTVNHADDSGLADHAAWWLHVHTVDEMRWPRIDINLAASPELIDEWLACGIQSRVTAVNPPPEVAGDDIDVIIEGHSETLGFKDWDIEANCSPAQPWDVGVFGTSLYDTAGSELAAQFISGTNTSMSVATTAGRVWKTGAVNFDIECGGARLTVTNITGASSPQTFTITQTPVNGINKTIPAGTAVRLWSPAVYAL